MRTFITLVSRAPTRFGVPLPVLGTPSHLGHLLPSPLSLSLSFPSPVPLIRTMESRIMIPLKISPLQ